MGRFDDADPPFGEGANHHPWILLVWEPEDLDMIQESPSLSTFGHNLNLQTPRGNQVNLPSKGAHLLLIPRTQKKQQGNTLTTHTHIRSSHLSRGRIVDRIQRNTGEADEKRGSALTVGIGLDRARWV